MEHPVLHSIEPFLVSLSEVFHSGTLLVEHKQPNSYEGPCLSTSLSQEDSLRWQAIAGLSGPCYRLTKSLGKGRFFAIQTVLLDPQAMQAIWHWAERQGYATRGTLYQVEQYDSELGDWLVTPFARRQPATEEYEELVGEGEEHVRFREMQAYLPTQKMQDWAGWDHPPLVCRSDFAALCFAECLGIDGGLWTYPGSAIAVPVAALYPHSVSGWSVALPEA
jgi:hypothetical protein